MAQFKKYLPIILALIAMATLYFNYDQWRMAKAKECDCDKEKSEALDLGPIP